MHIDGPDQITVAYEPTGFAPPYSAFGLLFMPTARTLTRCSSFRASEARDVSLFRFVGEIIDVFAILPQGHALIMMSAIISIAHAMRIANEERSDLLLDAKVNDLAGSFMALITKPPFRSLAHLVLCPLQFLPATGMFLAVTLLFGKLSQLLIPLVFERTDTTTCDDQGLLGIRGDSSKMDFSQVDRSLFHSWSLFSPWDFNADMQFKASVPDQRTGSCILWQIKRQDQRRTTSTHWQDDTSCLFAHRLLRPHDGIESLGFVGIAHLEVRGFELSGGFDVGKKGMDDHLNGLAMQGKASFCRLLQFGTSGPFRVFKTSLFMRLHATIPDLCRLHLSGFQSAKLAPRQVFKSIHAHGFHVMIIA